GSTHESISWPGRWTWLACGAGCPPCQAGRRGAVACSAPVVSSACRRRPETGRGDGCSTQRADRRRHGRTLAVQRRSGDGGDERPTTNDQRRTTTDRRRPTTERRM
ncbi:MAG: hypothetical protein AVDCRST_MAG26-2692, partial [uncultured Chloroflexia bacterium]